MNTFGRNFRVSLFGESHGPAIGVVLDGVPAGLEIAADDFAQDLGRRAPGAPGTTARREPDEPRIISGVYNGRTTGAPLTIILENKDARPEDYRVPDAGLAPNQSPDQCANQTPDQSPDPCANRAPDAGLAPNQCANRAPDQSPAQCANLPRPGHADYAAAAKWHGLNDPRGGGHFSGRLTAPIVAAGVIAKKVLARNGMSVEARLTELGGSANNKDWPGLIEAAASEGDSLGGIIECRITAAAGQAHEANQQAAEAAAPGTEANQQAANLPVGLGEPFWDSLESLLSHAVFAIPGIRGIEFGDGFAAAAMKGSEHNDPIGPHGPTKNGAGGINGGLSNGAPIVFRAAVKPTSSISIQQQTWQEGPATICVKGRHDVCFAQRVPVIVEAMAAIVLADQI